MSKSLNIHQENLNDLFKCYLRVQLGEAPLVKTAANVFQELCYSYRDQLTAGIICAGWDRRFGGQVRKWQILLMLFFSFKSICFLIEGFQHPTWGNVH